MSLKILGRRKTLKKKIHQGISHTLAKISQGMRNPSQIVSVTSCLCSGSTICLHAPLASHSSVPLLFNTLLEHRLEAHFSISIWHGPEGPLPPLCKVALRGRETLLLGCVVIRHLRRPTTTQGVTASRPQSSMRRPLAKRVRTSGLGEPSRAS